MAVIRLILAIGFIAGRSGPQRLYPLRDLEGQPRPSEYTDPYFQVSKKVFLRIMKKDSSKCWLLIIHPDLITKLKNIISHSNIMEEFAKSVRRYMILY